MNRNGMSYQVYPGLCRGGGGGLTGTEFQHFVIFQRGYISFKFAIKI